MQIDLYDASMENPVTVLLFSEYDFTYWNIP